MLVGKMEESRAACPACNSPVNVPFASRTIEVTRVCENCHNTWRVTATPVTRVGVGVLTQVSFKAEA